MSVRYVPPNVTLEEAREQVVAATSAPPTNVLVAYDAWPYGASPFHAENGGAGTWAYAIRHDVDTIGRSVILAEDPRQAAARLHGWRLRTGTPWVGTPGTSGQAILRALVSRGRVPEPTWTIDPACGSKAGDWDVPDELDQTARDWSRAPGRAATWLHEYDANAAYLAAAGNVPVARWRLHARSEAGTRTASGERLPGLYLAEIDAWTDPRLPHPAGPAAVRAGGRPIVVTHVTLAHLDTLREAGVFSGYRIICGNVCDKSTRLFRAWSETLRDMIYTEDKDDVSVACSRAAKAAYREAIGLMGRPGGRIYRPDWRAAIIAQARVTIWRRAWQILNDTGRAPVTINVDAITYASDSPDPIFAAPQHLPMAPNRLGGFKVKRSQLLGGEK